MPVGGDALQRPAAHSGTVGVVVAADTRIGLFGATDSKEIAWLGPGEQTTFPVSSLGASGRGLIAATGISGRIYLFGKTGQLISTRVAKRVRQLGFYGDRLVASSYREVLIWSIPEETRPFDIVNARVQALIGGR